ncbi:MAG: replication initiator protein A [Pseudomonadota bacterium]
MSRSTPEPTSVEESLLEQLLALPISNTEDGVETEQLELFVVSDKSSDWPVKDDISSMEFPIFSLSKKPDTRIREFSRGEKSLKVIPSVVGAATVFDKDVLIYAISQIIRAKEQGKPISRRIRIETFDFLKGTRRSTGGAAYERVIEMCRRLKGTTIETNIKTTEKERTSGFSLIDDYDISRYTKNGKGALEVDLTISEWLYRAVLDYGILTLNNDYFILTQSIERRLYELARKHCGDQAMWKCRIDLLQEKCGSTQISKSFANDLRKIAKENNLPDYRLLIDDSIKPTQVVFISRDMKKVLFEMSRANLVGWLTKLLQKHLPEAEKEA